MQVVEGNTSSLQVSTQRSYVLTLTHTRVGLSHQWEGVEGVIWLADLQEGTMESTISLRWREPALITNEMRQN